MTPAYIDFPRYARSGYLLLLAVSDDSNDVAGTSAWLYIQIYLALAIICCVIYMYMFSSNIVAFYFAFSCTASM